ncbi:MAG: hypothetical protein WCF36_01510 [Candidatus Nanopelagicales bacterium]
MAEDNDPGGPRPPGRLGGSDCERLRSGPIAQPVNTVTSSAYVVGAAAVLARAGRRGSVPGEVTAYCALMASVGLGSIAFHGPQPPGARAMHDVPIPVLVAWAIGTPLVRRRRAVVPLPGWSRARGAALALTSICAVAAYAGGRTGARTCDPDSPVQLHGAWHVLTAGSFVMVADILYRRGSTND